MKKLALVFCLLLMPLTIAWAGGNVSQDIYDDNNTGFVGIGINPIRPLHIYAPPIYPSCEMILEAGVGLKDYRSWNLFVAVQQAVVKTSLSDS